MGLLQGLHLSMEELSRLCVRCGAMVGGGLRGVMNYSIMNVLKRQSTRREGMLLVACRTGTLTDVLDARASGFPCTLSRDVS